jgi:MarR family transcriptional regulator for hemolysin
VGYAAAMVEPHREAPIGRVLWEAVSRVDRTFDEALARAGGSRSTWHILLALKQRPTANQREIAWDVGIQEATLTHHLAAMEADGLVVRRRDPNNRRVHLIELTKEGQEAFGRLSEAARAFDRRMRSGIADEEIDQLRATLEKMVANVGAGRRRP